MKFHELAVCLRCDRRYPIHRLWCDHCGKGLTQQARPLTEAEAYPLRGKFNTAIHLYEQVLHDLKDLSGRDRVEPWLHDKIRGFYRNRLRQIEAQKRALSVKQCLFSAHHLAVGMDNLEGALSRLHEGLNQSPKTGVIKEMVKEIRGRMKKMQALTRARGAGGAPENKEVIQAAGVPQPGAKVPDVSTAMAAEAAKMRVSEAKPAPFLPSFVQEEEIPSPGQRLIEGFSEWSRPLRPFLLDNIGWFVGVFLIMAGYVALLTTFWEDIEGNRLLRQCLLFFTPLSHNRAFLFSGLLHAYQIPGTGNLKQRGVDHRVAAHTPGVCRGCLDHAGAGLRSIPMNSVWGIKP